jgi:hypothetical protein
LNPGTALVVLPLVPAISRMRSSAIAGLGAAAMSAGLAGCGSGTASHSANTASTTTTQPPTPSAVAVAHPHPRHHRAGRPPGSLPQTHQLPSADTASFDAEMAALWRGIRTGSLKPAMPAFFPERAYVQLKQIGDPRGDWTGRLVAYYGLDIEAAHELLGAGAARARLVGVQVPSEYVHWVDPGACDNGVGYYEVPDSRVVYREDGAVNSFGIASMISWRGVWYVVHLGAVLRSGGGQVDDPSAGTGTSAPSSTC